MTGGRVGGTDVAMAYDGLGRRTSRSLGAAETQYWYDATGLSLETGAERGTYLRDPSGQLLSAVTSTGFANYATDRLGSVTATTNAGGNLVNTYRYQPFGGLLHSTGSGRNPFQFTGTYLDGATGLYQMGARYYQPGTGRFTQADPLPSSVMEANRYAYVGGNPVNRVDPTGLFMEDCGEAAFFDCASGDLANVFSQASGSWSGKVTLYRAVSSAELADIQAIGGFRAGSGTMETKLFATSQVDALNFGYDLYGDQPFSLVAATIPASYARQLFRFTADGRETVAVYPEQLGEFNALAEIGYIW